MEVCDGSCCYTALFRWESYLNCDFIQLLPSTRSCDIDVSHVVYRAHLLDLDDCACDIKTSNSA